MSDYEKELYSIIGNMLRDLRLQKDYTLEYVAEKLDVAPKTLQRYECGERKIKVGTITELCEIYGADYSDFMREAKLKHLGEDLPGNTTPYYMNDDARELAQFMFENPEYKVLFDASRKVKKEDIEFVRQFMDRMRGDVDDTGC